jgi:hypothetical protein
MENEQLAKDITVALIAHSDIFMKKPEQIQQVVNSVVDLYDRVKKALKALEPPINEDDKHITSDSLFH